MCDGLGRASNRGIDHSIPETVSMDEWCRPWQVILKSDQEPTTTERQRTTNDERPIELEVIMKNMQSIRRLHGEMAVDSVIAVLEGSPVGGSRSNVALEEVIKRTQGQVRTVKAATEERIMEQTSANPPVWQWLVECSADTFHRYKAAKME